MTKSPATFLRFVVLAAAATLVACDAPPSSDAGDAGDAAADADAGPNHQIAAEVVHEFPDYTLQPGGETIPCVQWTLNNEEPLYVNKVTLSNGGGYHHSNWFVVPEDYAPGEDGYFNCDDRGFHEVNAAQEGTVLFAQSTQARSEVQQFAPGAVIKIPPNHKVVADVHMLNVSTRKLDTFSRLTLGLVHPKDVDVVLTPFRLTYYDLEIPPKSRSRFTSECNFAERYPGDFDLELYYVLPHYHELGSYFDLEVFGGPRDGEQLYELQGFNAEANGHAFREPVDLSGAKGFRFTCGYDNPRDETVGWGLGGQEMCVMLGFAKAKKLFDASVQDGNEVDRREDGIVYNSGSCLTLGFDKPDAQSPPTEEEKTSELYVPKSEDDDDLKPIPECEEIEQPASPQRPPTLTNLHKDVFSVTCAFSSCHGAQAPAAGLDLKTREGLHDRLMNHDLTTPAGMPLVDPGRPDNSWLHRVTSECQPQTEAGPVSHMPRNSPILMDPEVVAMIREWIERGANDN